MLELSRLRQGLCGIVAGFVLGSCGNVSTTPERPEIKPQDFALVPCGPGLAERPCALVVAGGKRVLFGAPAGVAATLEKDDLRQLDAVMLFSLRAADIEGLDEVRNETWWAGRDEPLLVVGPEGTGDMVEALNKAFEQADALRIVEEGIPPGGYDAAVLKSVEHAPGAADATVFTTGDLHIRVFKQTYVVDYNENISDAHGQVFALITGCIADQLFQLTRYETIKIFEINCTDEADMKWPITETIFLK